MSTKQANPAKPLVLREPIKLAQVNPRVMTLMQDTTLTKQANRVKSHVQQESTIQTQVLYGQSSVLNLLSDITFQHPARPAKQLVLREPIKQAQVNPRVTMLIQGITFQHRAKQARPLVQ